MSPDTGPESPPKSPNEGLSSSVGGPRSPEDGLSSSIGGPKSPDERPSSPFGEPSSPLRGPKSPIDEPMSPDDGPSSPQQTGVDSQGNSFPQSPDGSVSDSDSPKKRTSNLDKDDSDSLDLMMESSAKSPKEYRKQSSIDPEDINSPESDMGDQENIPSNAEDIDSPESDLEDDREEKSEKVLESAASPISESDDESAEEDDDSKKVKKNEMYNDVSDEEDSFSDDDDNKIDSYKVDGAVKDALQSSDRDSKQRWRRGSESRNVASKAEHVGSVPRNSTDLGEDHVELDYDEDVVEEDHGKSQEENREKMDDSRGADSAEKDKKEDVSL